MARYISAADTSKLIRKALKAAFPGAKFSVRTSTYSGGASAQVTYTDGPALEDVNAIAKPFAGGSFDGMIDLMSYHTSDLDGEEVRFGTHFVFVDRIMSIEFLQRMADGINYAKADLFEIAADSTGAHLKFVGDFTNDWQEFLSMQHWILDAARKAAA